MSQRFRKLTKYETDDEFVASITLGKTIAEASFNPDPDGAPVLGKIRAITTGRRRGLKLRHVVCSRVVRPATATAGDQKAYNRFVIKTLDALSTITIGSVLDVDGIDWTVDERVNERKK